MDNQLKSFEFEGFLLENLYGCGPFSFKGNFYCGSLKFMTTSSFWPPCVDSHYLCLLGNKKLFGRKVLLNLLRY